jgi:hypothetical protein
MGMVGERFSSLLLHIWGRMGQEAFDGGFELANFIR